jgi:DNA-binding Lrp family transcriptional regulator
MWKFLKTEMLVILALTEDADRTDAEIADAYGMKKGTVSSARRRLLDAGAIHYAYVPAFNRLGCEMLGVHYGTTDPAVRSDTKANHYMEFCSRTPQIYHALIGGSSLIIFTALRNATEFESIVQHHNAFFAGSRHASKAKLTHCIFPYALSRITLVPQFASIVHNFFELEVPPPKRVPIVTLKHETVDLSPTDRKTITAMVTNPIASDREIASVVKLSRQAITRLRNRYTEEELLTKICIPRLYRWGFEIYAVAHPKFSTDIGWDKRIKSQPKEAVERSFYTFSKADESIANFMVSKFSEYSEKLENILAWYHKVKAFEERLEIVLFSLDRSTELRTFDYTPAVKQLLRQEHH